MSSSSSMLPPLPSGLPAARPPLPESLPESGSEPEKAQPPLPMGLPPLPMIPPLPPGLPSVQPMVTVDDDMAGEVAILRTAAPTPAVATSTTANTANDEMAPVRATIPTATNRVTATAPLPSDAPLLTIAPTMPDEADTTDGLGKFVFGEELGRGGMGVVHVAHDRRLRRELAIKTLVRAKNREAAAQFVEEAQITGQLEHPNIVPIHELGTDTQGFPWLAMKRVQGQTLSEWMAQPVNAGALTPERVAQVLSIFDKICDALAFAHSRHIIHRDLKPDNIMVGEFGEILVMDWGLAKPLTVAGFTNAEAPTTLGATLVATAPRNPSARASSRPVSSSRREAAVAVTIEGTISGTPAFMAPEQALGETREVDARTDVFALGGILYALLTQKVPYDGATALMVVAQAATHDLVPPRLRVPSRHIPRELEAIVLKAMAKQKTDRYATVADFQADLRAFQAHLPTLAYRPTLSERCIKWSRRHPTATVGMAMAAGFATVLSVVVGAMLAHAGELDRERLMATAVAERRERERLEATALAERETRERIAAQAEAQQHQLDRQIAEQTAREAELRAAMRAGQLDRMRELLDVQVRARRDAVVDAFIAHWRTVMNSGISGREFLETLAAEEKESLLDAFARLFAAHREFDVEVTEHDYFFHGLLLQAFRNDYDGAKRCYDEVLARQPSHADALANRAQLHETAGNLPAALADATAAVEARPHALYFTTRGNIYAKLGHHRDALADFATAIQRDPNYLHAYISRANLLRDTGQLPQALADYDFVVSRRPEWADVYEMRGRLHHRRRDFSAAVADFSRAIDLGMKTAMAYRNRGAARMDWGHHTEAIDDLRHALQLDPQLWSTHSNLGVVYGRLGEYEQAMEFHNRAVELAPQESHALHNRAWVLLQMGDYSAAVADFTASLDCLPPALRRSSQAAATYHFRGTAHFRRSDHESALADWRQAADLNPSDWNSLTNAAAVLKHLGRDADARSAFAEAQRRCPPANQPRLDALRRQIFGPDTPD